MLEQKPPYKLNAIGGGEYYRHRYRSRRAK